MVALELAQAPRSCGRGGGRACLIYFAEPILLAPQIEDREYLAAIRENSIYLATLQLYRTVKDLP
ncbi:hypothetical protein AB0P17_00915 [Streptomyces sp. NPDC088124]|uniref:hypothetical protein n=1 Tax=Streptomyces sp. NPDC088124 TaxID=3154654 RepID=UPI003445EAD7